MNELSLFQTIISIIALIIIEGWLVISIKNNLKKKKIVLINGTLFIISAIVLSACSIILAGYII